jgi:DDE family transposase
MRLSAWKFTDQAVKALPVIPRRVDARHKNALPLFADGTRNAPWIPFGSERFKTLYKRRSAVEREFGRLKHEYGLAFLRVRGIERVRLHADLTMLGRLSLALARARAVPLASA